MGSRNEIDISDNSKRSFNNFISMRSLNEIGIPYNLKRSFTDITFFPNNYKKSRYCGNRQSWYIYLRKTPPRRLAFRHSGGESRLCTSATVTLYLLVLLSNDNRPGTEQNTSEGCAFPVSMAFSLLSEGFMSAKHKANVSF